MLNGTYIAKVKRVIMDESDVPYYDLYGKEDSIGSILFYFLEEVPPALNSSLKGLPHAKPLNYHFSYYPTENEVVHIITSPANDYHQTGNFNFYYTPPVNMFNSPSSNPYPDVLDEDLKYTEGKYFKGIENIRPLRPYEGDIMIEGRYGNSIRFGSTVPQVNEEGKINTTHLSEWSKEGDLGNPIIIIRNGQAGNEQEETYTPILEDINKDDSSIYLCSNQQISNFEPAAPHLPPSYGHEIIKEKNQVEPNFSNEDMNPETEEDVYMNSAEIVSPNDMTDEELEIITSDDTAPTYDNGGPTTEEQVIYTESETELPSNYEIPEVVDINAPLGEPIDNTAVSPFTVPGDTGDTTGDSFDLDLDDY
jgi:hypothetical protein